MKRMMKQVFSSYDLPEEGEWILYYFEPFEKWYCGTFYKAKEGDLDDGVSGKYGFTTWNPEITMWMRGIDK